MEGNEFRDKGNFKWLARWLTNSQETLTESLQLPNLPLAELNEKIILEACKVQNHQNF